MFKLLSPLCRTAMLQIYEKGGNDVTSEYFRSDPMFLRNQFRGDGVFELPIIRRQEIDLKAVALIGYDHTKPADSKNANRFVHFFLTTTSLKPSEQSGTPAQKVEPIQRRTIPAVLRVLQYAVRLANLPYLPLPLVRRVFSVQRFDGHSHCLLGKAAELLVLL